MKKILRKVNQVLWHFVGSFTLVNNSEKMSPETRKLLEDYYRDEVKQLQNVIGKDLKDLWFE